MQVLLEDARAAVWRHDQGPPAPHGTDDAQGIAAPVRPEKIHFDAQDKWLATGKKLSKEENAKRAKHPFDMWDEMLANAASGSYPKGTDGFLYRVHGLFYVAPAQDSYMCRLRIPNGILIPAMRNQNRREFRNPKRRLSPVPRQ